MRVLETDPSVIYKMGKTKKHKIRKAKENDADDSSEDGILNGCPHVSKAINCAAVRKFVLKPTVTLGECTACSKDLPKAAGHDLFGSLIEGPASTSVGDESECIETAVCICLQCGQQGCDRNSPNKHALKHYKTPHSGLHCININLTTWSTWCYICDEEVPLCGKIQRCLDILQKQAGIAKPDTAQASSRSLESPVTDAPTPLPNSVGAKNVAPVSCMKVKGLSNLGNTCFFNAVMQSMCQTRGLDAILCDRIKQGSLCNISGLDLCIETDSSGSDDDEDEDSISRKKALPSIQTNLGDAGQVTLTLLNFVQEMKGGTTRNGIVNPTPLFTQVCKKAPRFKGFQQQDSHELLRYLIDSIRTEEIKRGQASILKFFKLPETINPKKVDEETKVKVKEYGRQVKHTFLDSLFGGQLVSTVKCEECKSISQIFETFLDLSLPVMEEKPQRPNLVLVGKKKDHLTLPDGMEDTGGGASAAGSADVDAYTDRPSKYQERKNKRMAKKDSKRKAKLQKSKSFENNENDIKEDKEDKVGQDSEGLSDGNKTGPEKEAIHLESPAGGQCSNSGRLIRNVLTPHSSNTSVESIVDNQPGGGKHGAKSADQEEADDPSDADVEDNLDSDMHRVGSTVSSCQITKSSFPNGDANIVKDNTPSEANSIISSHVTDSSYSSSHVLVSSQSEENSKSVTILNGDVNGHRAVSFSPTKAPRSASEKSLCEDLSQVSLIENHLSGVDGTSISCEVSITNSSDCSQVLQLANGLGKLTVETSDTNELACVTNGDDVVDIANCRREENSKCEVSSSFTLALPSLESVDHNQSSNETAKDELSLSLEIEAKDNYKSLDTREAEDKKSNLEAQLSQPSQDKQNPPTLHNVVKARQEYLKQARSYSMNTLSPRYHPSPKECSILSCLNQFTAAELLTGSNKFGCKECTKRQHQNSHVNKGDKKSKDTVYSNASKQYLIFRPPAVLTLHLKRFEQTGLTSRKVNRHVDFPLLLDLAPYCSSLCLGVKEAQTKVLYSLYAVVEHSGRLSGGHYTAYIKVRPGLGSHTQFLHTQPPASLDLLNVYLGRIVKSKEVTSLLSREEELLSPSKQDLGSPVDKDVEARAENLLPPGRWFHISDSRVNEVTEAVVLRAQAYLLFYERIF